MSSNNDYLQEEDEKVEPEVEPRSENEERTRSEDEQDLGPAKEQTWGFSRARMPTVNDSQSGLEGPEPGTKGSFTCPILSVRFLFAICCPTRQLG